MKKIYLLIIVLISLTTTYKAYMAYETFSENNVPVYDGVMYENRQIQSYLKYNDNFSLMERVNQTIYEFERNQISAGFCCAIALINPKWFINDGDIIIRSFLSVFLFSLVLFHYLKSRVSPVNALIIITLLFQLPLFYNYRYGLNTYIPEIPSALFLLSGYIQLLNFFKSKKTLHFLSAAVFITISIMFRFNFFVYSFFFLIPLLYKCFLIIKEKPKKQILLLLGFLVVNIGFLAFYIFSHLSFFLSYYSANLISETPYAEVSTASSLQYLMTHFNAEIGITGLVALVYILFLSNQESSLEKRKMETFYLLYPFAFFFGFIILYLSSTNVPHIIAAMVVFLIPLFLIPNKNMHKIYSYIQLKYIRYLAVLLIVILNIQYVYSYKSFSKTLPEQLAHKQLVDLIIREKGLSPKFKYLCFYDEMVEIQVDVSVFQKTGIWLNSLDRFYFHDAYLEMISKTLNPKECADYFEKKIETENYELIAINKGGNKPMKPFKTASEANAIISKFMESNPHFFLAKRIVTDYHGEVLLFKRKPVDSEK